MRVNHNLFPLVANTTGVVSDLCKDTKMRVNHNSGWADVFRLAGCF